ncbi:MAG: AEC family transporter [Micrococcales bacterium]|nr:AEC family transporter [Micrococcales bacterium]
MSAFTGFVVIGGLVGAGYLVARLRLVDDSGALVLNRVAFFVAVPALLFTVVSRAEVSVMFSWFVVVAGLAALVTAGLFVAASRLWFRVSLADTTMGAACAAYVNSNNIGLPVATYIVGDAQYVVPQILVQVLVFSPVVLGVLDLSTRGRVQVRDVLLQPVRNPVVAATALGAVVAVTGWSVPDIVVAPLDVLGGAAVPLVLMAFGMSLRGQRPLAPGSPRRAVLVATGLKVGAMPAVAWLLAVALRLPAHLLFAVVVSAALPTAQNMNSYAARYGRAQVLARDSVALSTVAAVPVILVLTVLLR